MEYNTSKLKNMITELKKTRTSFLASFPSSSKIIAVSSDAGDIGQTLSVVGSGSDTLTLTGRDYVTGETTFTSLSAMALSASAEGTVSIYTEGAAGGAVYYLGAGTIVANNTMAITISGLTTTYTFKASADIPTAAANCISLGNSNADAIGNLVKAIGLTGAAGTDYSTGTGDVTYLSTTYTAGQTTFSITDKTKIRRPVLPTWSTTTTSATCTPFTVGSTGVLLAQLTTGEISVSGILTLTNPLLAVSNLPAYTMFVTDWIRIRGARSAIRFLCENVTTELGVTYQTSVDGQTVFASGVEAVDPLDNNSTPTYFEIPEVCEYIRVAVNNPNSGAVKVHGVLISQA